MAPSYNSRPYLAIEDWTGGTAGGTVAEDTSSAGNELQFERVVTDQLPPAADRAPAVMCAGCQARLQAEYYEINGRPFCGDCRGKIEGVAEPARGLLPFAVAAIFGLGAAVAGAAIYYAVIAITHLEIGLVAILIGYMVGYAVRKGAGNRGGRRFQVLAVALTYGAVALAYTPVVISAAIKERNEAQKAAVTKNSPPPSSSSLQAVAEPPPSSGGMIHGLVMTLGFILALPMLVVFGSMPSGLISGAIIFFGMQQAWKMTAVPPLQVLGPFRVGSESASLPA